jgi:hypothetical protein
MWYKTLHISAKMKTHQYNYHMQKKREGKKYRLDLPVSHVVKCQREIVSEINNAFVQIVCAIHARLWVLERLIYVFKYEHNFQKTRERTKREEENSDKE